MSLRLAFAVTLAAIFFCLCPAAPLAGGGKAIVYIGTFRSEPGRGIYAFRLDAGSGAIEPLGLAAETSRPVFLALHPNRRFLYAASRPTPVERQNVGVVLAYALDPRTGKLTALNSRPSSGIDPAYVALDRAGKHLLVANYGSNTGGGSVAVFPIGKDGHLADASDSIQYSGSGVHPERQRGAHSHAINLSPDNRFVFVTDLGLDKIFVYRFDAARGKLTPHDPPFHSLSPGAGPRHFAFHPNGRFFYVVNEIQSSLTAFAYDARSGALKELHTISTLPKDFAGANTSAEVQVHPGGKFLYASNRGHDSLAVFTIDFKSGALTPVEWTPTRGKTPRHFGIAPGGAWLVAANQGSNSLVMFRIDRQTGRLQATGQSFEVSAPSCVKFLALD